MQMTKTLCALLTLAALSGVGCATRRASTDRPEHTRFFESFSPVETVAGLHPDGFDCTEPEVSMSGGRDRMAVSRRVSALRCALPEGAADAGEFPLAGELRTRLRAWMENGGLSVVGEGVTGPHLYLDYRQENIDGTLEVFATRPAGGELRLLFVVRESAR